jgi:hypothetical protein
MSLTSTEVWLMLPARNGAALAVVAPRPAAATADSP